MSSNGAAPAGGLALTRPETKALNTALDLEVDRVVEQTRAIQKVMQRLMVSGEHYGVIPGTEKQDREGRDISKPSLFQPGADKLCLLFRIRPEYQIDSLGGEDFIALQVRCRLIHIVTGEIWGEGMGACNSREAKYANQSLAKLCPACKKPAIIKGKEEMGGGWVCWRKKDGCGRTFDIDDPAIANQNAQVVGSKAWDFQNTILKMACKRARVAAVLTATAASDIFTQDLEDWEDVAGGEPGVSVNQGGQGREQPQGGGQQQGQPSRQAQANEPASRRASPAAIKDLNVLLAELGVKAEERVGWCTHTLGRAVGSMPGLSADDAVTLTRIARQQVMEGSTGPGEQGGEQT